jgi:hypothetical protein
MEQDCEETFEVVHSMKEKLNTCSECSQNCEKQGNIERVPLNMTNVLKKNLDTNKKTGNLVKKNIEEFRENLKNEKRRLKKVEYQS